MSAKENLKEQGKEKTEMEEVARKKPLESKSVSYNLGRLYAVLEKVLMDNEGPSPLRSNHFRNAMCNPAVEFPNLESMVIKYVEPGSEYDKIITGIYQSIAPDDFPRVMPAREQSSFCLGYYHQKSALYRDKAD